MAPRTAKAKKASEASEAPKKGRGKTKNVEEVEPEIIEQDIDEKQAVTVIEKKKRGKKAAEVSNGLEENGKTEETAPPAKKGRKKNVEEAIVENNDEEMAESNPDLSGEEEPLAQEEEANGDAKDTQSAPAGRGRKKQAKKEPAAEKVKPEPKPSRGRKAKQEVETEDVDEEKEVVEEKPKPAAKGRGRKAQPKAEPETENKEEEEAKPDLAPTKGRKKAQPKSAKEKTPETDEQEVEEESEETEAELPKKKETKVRKPQGKKAQPKDENEDKDEQIDEAPSKKRKINKKDDKGKGDTKDEEAIEEEVAEPKAKGRRGKKPAETPEPIDDDAPDSGDATTKRRRKPTEDKAPANDKKKAPKNKAATDYEELDFSNTSKSKESKDWNFKISSWNVDGIRAWMSKGGLDYLKYEKPDILCLQETKCSQDKLPEDLADVPGYHAYWACSDKDGYAGVGIYTTQLAMNVQYGLQNEEFDNEGRIITAEYEQFYLICTYVPNAGRKLVTLPKRLQWNEEFRKFVKKLDEKKPVIICGDMNVSHQEIDLANPKTNRKNAGFTEEERAGMTDLLGDGFVDTFRLLYPDKTGSYTFWTYMMNSRAKNVGWRLDYFIVSERLLPAICDNVIRDQVYGSDHCPISLFLYLKGADKPKE